jgi:serine/threonine protein kinase
MDAPGIVPDSINCHSCGAVLDLTGQTGFTHVECTRCGALSVVPLQFGDFLLLNAIGIGGTGTVYKAIDLPLNRYLALKILRKKLSSDPSFIASFSREARAAAAVRHPNIAHVYSFDERDGQYYLAMELCDRGSLDDRITKLGKLSEPEVLSIGQQIASALRAAWQRGLLHRDVKPGNILFNEDGVPKIVDFGLARGQGKDPDGASDQIWGTPYYIAPEKLRGKPEDVRSDIYSLGATLFHALAGRPPFDAATAREVANKHTTQPAFSLKTYVPTIHEHTMNVIARMLAKDPSERYDTYDEVTQDLAEAQDFLKMTRATKPIVVSTGERFSLSSVVGTLATVIICMAMVWLVWRNRVGIFQLEQPTTTEIPSPLSSTPSQPAAVVSPEAPPETVNFSGNDPWLKAWNGAMFQLAQGRYSDALLEYDNALQLAGQSQPRPRQWIELFEGLTLLAADRPGEADGVFARARDGTTQPGVPEVITTGNFASVLIDTMLGTIPLAEVEAAVPRMPPWAGALTRFTASFRYLGSGEFDKAAASFRQYNELHPTTDEPWAFNLQELAGKLARQSDLAAATIAEIDSLSKAGKYGDALAALDAASNKNGLAALKQALLEKRPGLERAAAQERENGEKTVRDAEASRAKREELDRQGAADEAGVIQAVAPLWQNYDFKAVVARYEAYSQKAGTHADHKLLDQQLKRARRLVEFKEQLAADFARRPYEGTDLETRGGAPLPGRIVRATDREIVCSTPYGEIVSDWRDLTPVALIKLADFYAMANAATDTPDARGQRFLRLAIFCKQYGQESPAIDYAQRAVEQQPSLQLEVDSITTPPPAAGKTE